MYNFFNWHGEQFMLSSLMKPNSSKMIGIDIGAHNVKGVLLSKSSNGYKVEATAKLPLPKGAVVDNVILDVESVGNVIAKLRKKFPKAVKNVIAAVSGSGVISKTVYLNAVQNDEELESQIEIEAENLIPYPLDEVSIDFEIIGENENDSHKIDVLLIASRTELVQARVSSIEAGNFFAKVMDVNGYALGRTYSLISHQFDDDTSKPVALIDIGATTLTLAVIVDGETVFIKEQPFGGEQYTQSIAAYYNMEYAEAETAKLNDELPRNYVFEVLAPFQTAMIQQIRRTLQMYSTSKYGSEISHILLSGGCSQIPTIDKVLSEELNIPTNLAKPFLHSEVHKDINFDALNKEASMYMVASGLALRSFT